VADKRTRERAKQVARKMLEAWNAEGETYLPEDLMGPTLVTHFPQRLERANGGARRRVASEAALPREAFSGQRFEEEIVLSDGEYVFLAWSVTATNDGPVFGRAPTGKEVRVYGADVIRVDQGRIAEHWDYYTKARTHALAQLGLLDAEMQKTLEAERLLGRGPATAVG
jgi:predicted ester cyclase